MLKIVTLVEVVLEEELVLQAEVESQVLLDVDTKLECYT